MARQLNQAQCGQGARTDGYHNCKMRGVVSRLHPDTGGGGKINWPAGGLYLGAKQGPGGVTGAAALPVGSLEEVVARVGGEMSNLKE